ncbi:hypothetical protein SEEC0006_21709, partial [Salmonella enterica subsp. enterica serovar Choleraesuis str. 0006]
MTGIGEKIFAGSRIAGNQQRRAEHRQFARLLNACFIFA